MSKNLFVFLLTFFSVGAIWAQVSNGFYVGEVCEKAEANILYYNTPLKVQVDKPLKFKGGHIHSSSNRNDLHRIALEVEKVPENTWLILKIDESYYATCLRSKKSKKKRRYGSKKKSKPIIEEKDKVTNDTSNSGGGFVIEKRSDAEQISKFLTIDIVDRKHFGHQMIGKLEAQQEKYHVGDSILLDFTLENNSEVPVQIRMGTPWPRDGKGGGRDPVFQFKAVAVHNGKSLKNKQKRSNNEAFFVSRMVNNSKTITKDDILKRAVYLNHWFDFDAPCEYLISWRYRMKLQDMRREYDRKREPEFYWDDEVLGSFVLVVE